MLEIPESATLARQIIETLSGKKISKVENANSPHKFAFYNGDPLDYPRLLTGKTVVSAKGHGMFVDILFDENTNLTIGDGTNIRYYTSWDELPPKHQLLLEFEDGSRIVFTVAMYGAIFAYQGVLDNSYHRGSLNSISPLEERFDEAYFSQLLKNQKKILSAKALLATEQRIPGLGNGVLQDILFQARIHPKRKMSTFSDFEKNELFHSLKMTLRSMTEKGGRDTEKDLYGKPGGYKSLLSKNTLDKPCPHCGDTLVKEAYLGGAVYFCPTCQKM